MPCNPFPQTENHGVPSRDEKRHAFEKFYKGWRDYMEGRPMFAPPDWDEAARQ
jgi:hypothetical protein